MNDNKKKIELWRILVFILAVGFISFMWIKKDISGIYTTMPSEQSWALIVVTIVVSLLKVLAITGVMLLVKFIIGKIKTSK